MQEFIANAKASGEEITWGTSGAATMRTTIGVFFDSNGIWQQKVPFKGGSKARAALVSQSVDAVFGGVFIQALKRTSALWHLLVQTVTMAPDLPTFVKGSPGVEYAGLMCCLLLRRI